MTPCRPSNVLPDQLHRVFNVPLVRIAALYHGHRDAVRTEDDIHIARIRKFTKGLVNRFGKGFEIVGIVVEVFNHVNAWLPSVGMKMAGPLVQTAAGSGPGILRVKWKEH